MRIPARIKASAGLVRSLEVRFGLNPVFEGLGMSPQSTAGMRPARTALGEQPGAFNGVIIATELDPDEFIYRHRNNQLGDHTNAGSEILQLHVTIKVAVEHFECVSWQGLPAEVEYVYVQYFKPEYISHTASLDWPLLQSYVDTQLTDFLEYGEDFAREWLETTRGFPKSWLNDREIARRPWIKQSKFMQIDTLLRDYPGAARNTFQHRSLDVARRQAGDRDDRW